MAGPGWYSDPADTSWERFYDGARWTNDRRPAGGPGAEQSAPSQWYPFAAPGGASDEGPGGAAAQSTQQFRPVETAPHPEAGPQQQDRPPAHVHRSRKRIPLIIGAVVIVVAGLLAGGYFLFFRSSPAKFTYNGKAIADPASTLQRAGQNLTSLVATRHGAKSGNSRCYYAVPDNPAKGTKKTDVAQSLWCGPVLFVDGQAGKEYLRFGLTSAPAKDGKITLAAASSPAAKDPGAVPAGMTLERPDGATPPAGNGGLTPPDPPAAAKNVLVSASIGSQAVPAASAGAVIGSIHGGVRLTHLGTVTRYGSGDHARTAPPGQKLIAFTLGAGYDNDGSVADLRKSATVSVDGGHPRAVPVTSGDSYDILAVPQGAHSVDLVLSDGGYRQTLSLLNGKPGGKNVTVLARHNRATTVGKKVPVQLHFSQPVVFGDGAQGTSETVTVSVQDAFLYFALDPKHVKASGPGKALLHIGMTYSDPHSPGSSYGLDPGIVRFTPTGGSAVAAKNVAVGANKIYDVFEVPGALTTGTLTISGSYKSTFANDSSSYTTTVSKPVSIPVAFKAG